MNAPELYIDDNDRYSRLRLISWWEQERLAAAHVLVVGAGALGNEVLKNLALVGVGKITVIDCDHIEAANLSRAVLMRGEDQGRSKAEVAARAIREINPEIEVHYINGNVITDVGLGTVAAMDAVIGCLDNREARLWVNRMCWKVNRPFIDGGIQELNGVVKIFVPPNSACYECGMTDNDYRLIQVRYSCPLLPREELLAGKVPTAPTIASIIGGMLVQEVLKIVHDLPVESGTAIVFNGLTNQMYQTRLPYREDCLSHDTYEQIIEVELGHRSTVDELFQVSSKFLQSPPRRLRLDRDLIVALSCDVCQRREEIMVARYAIDPQRSLCSQCHQALRPEMIDTIEVDGSFLGATLADVGIPHYDIVEVSSDEESVLLRLSGDRPPSQRDVQQRQSEEATRPCPT